MSDDTKVTGPAVDRGPAADVVKAVVDAYYPRGVAAADRARDRAQSGYTIASAIAAALVAAGAFAKLGDKPAGVQAVGLAALAAWLLAALLFIWVIAVPTRAGTDPGAKTAGEFLHNVSTRVNAELSVIRRRQSAAVATTTLAIVLTLLALALATTQNGDRPPERAHLALTPQADAALRTLCGPQVGELYGTVDPDKLGDAAVPVELPAGECGTQAATVELPKGSILAEQRLTDQFPGFPR
jgi:hypothetical protein